MGRGWPLALWRFLGISRVHKFENLFCFLSGMLRLVGRGLHSV